MVPRSRTRQSRLEAVRRQFDRWHQTRAHPRVAVPRRLVAAAVALVPEHGIYATARALGISYGALKRHVDQRRPHPRRRRKARFVELPLTPVAAGPVIELDNGAGLTLRVRLDGVALADVATFARLLTGGAS